MSKQLLAVYANLIPAAERISIFATIDKQFKGSTDAFIDACFDKSIFRSHEAFNAFLDKANAKTLESDLMVRYVGYRWLQGYRRGYEG